MEQPRPALISRVLVCLLFLGSTGNAQAGSDGMFCQGDRYLAYERTNEAGDARTLNVVMLGGESGLPDEPDTLEMDYFQPYAMRCSSTTVTLVGWDADYDVSIPLNEDSLSVTDRPTPPPTAPALNLGFYAPDGITRHSWPPIDSHHFELVIQSSSTTKIYEGGMGSETLTQVISEIVQKTEAGEIRKRLVVFDEEQQLVAD